LKTLYSKDHVLAFIKNDIKKDEKKKLALGYEYDEETKRSIAESAKFQKINPCLGHFVALKVDKSDGKDYFRIIDFQIDRNEPKHRFFKETLPPNATPPFHLFLKLHY